MPKPRFVDPSVTGAGAYWWVRHSYRGLPAARHLSGAT